MGVIEILAGFPDDVAAYACHGHLTKADYEAVLDDIEDKLTRHEKLRMYCEVCTDYAGSDGDAAWQDWKSSFSTWFHWDRGAIVTDVDWMVWATMFFALLVPGEWRAYGTADAADARAWVTGQGTSPGCARV